MRAQDRHFDATLHFLVVDPLEDKNRVIAASYVGIPEATTAVTAGFIENRPLFIDNEEYFRSLHPYRRLERKIGEGDVVHGMVYNSLATIQGIEEQLESDKSDTGYIIALDGDVEKAVSHHVQARFGLPKEWLEHYNELFSDKVSQLQVIQNPDLTTLWPDMKACRFDGNENEVLEVISEELSYMKKIMEEERENGTAVGEMNNVLIRRGCRLIIPKTTVQGRFNPEWGMKDYMLNNSEVFGKLLAKLKPRHQVGDPIDPAIGTTMKRIPFPAQANMIQALVNTLDYETSVICSGDMGTGKSIISTGVTTVLHERRKQNGANRGTAVLLSAPGITLKKWRSKEILPTLPHAKVHIINNSNEALQLYRKVRNGYQPQGLEFYLVGIDKAKMSPEPYFGGVWKRVKGTKSEYGWHCPDCGNQLMKTVDEEIQPLEWGDLAYGWPPSHEEIEEARMGGKLGPNGLIEGQKVKWRKSRRVKKCTHNTNFYKNEPEKEEFLQDLKEHESECHTKLWRPAIKKRGETRIRKRTNISNVLRRMNGWFDLFIMDEVHQAKAGDSGRGDAFAQMVKAAKKNLLLTGTLTTGKSTSIKEILWRTDAKSLLEVDVNHKTGDITWAERYGKLKQVVKLDDEEETGWTTRRKRKAQMPTEEPGIAPQMTTQFLLHKAGFLELGDMGLPLVELKEMPIFIDFDREHGSYYHSFHEELHKRCSLAAMAGAKGAFSKFIPATINYADRPDLGAYVQFGDDDDGDVIGAPSIDGRHAKERELIKLVKKELRENRRCVVFTQYTGKFGINERIQEVLREEGITCRILNETNTDKRSDRLEELKEAEIPVVICNMGLVEVGLDLLYWPSIIYYRALCSQTIPVEI
ncbi:hypothetical protein KH400_16305 [Desertibacillus haloalkaliphilus]|nr:hypothetical protein [Desertibacillus haloalkaliphilus]